MMIGGYEFSTLDIRGVVAAQEDFEAVELSRLDFSSAMTFRESAVVQSRLQSF